MRSYLKENEIRIKNGTDVNAVMREMMSVILEIPWRRTWRRKSFPCMQKA